MSTARPAARHQSRRAALQALYAADLSDRGGEQQRLGADEAFERIATHFDLPRGAREFAVELVRGVDEHREALDERVASCARNWRVSRMAAVDRNVLRLAAYELVHTDTPASVVLDEAIELARDFGGERSPAFVNGVLDALAHSLEGTTVVPEEGAR